MKMKYMILLKAFFIRIHFKRYYKYYLQWIFHIFLWFLLFYGVHARVRPAMIISFSAAIGVLNTYFLSILATMIIVFGLVVFSIFNLRSFVEKIERQHLLVFMISITQA